MVVLLFSEMIILSSGGRCQRWWLDRTASLCLVVVVKVMMITQNLDRWHSYPGGTWPTTNREQYVLNLGFTDIPTCPLNIVLICLICVFLFKFLPSFIIEWNVKNTVLISSEVVTVFLSGFSHHINSNCVCSINGDNLCTLLSFAYTVLHRLWL